MLLRACLLALLLFVPSGVVPALAHDHGPAPLEAVALEQRLNEPLPLALDFFDESGHPVTLGDYFGARPVIMVLVQFQCPNLCPLLVGGLIRALRAVPFDAGDQFDVVVVSLDPEETPQIAAETKSTYLERYDREGADQGWHFLTGDESAIQHLAAALGYTYAYDAESNQFAHPAALAVVTPQGTIANYFFGIEYSPRDLRLALVEASHNRIGSPVDHVLLRCYRYDPSTGQYTLVIMEVIRLAGIATVFGLGAFMFVMFRRERRSEL